MGKSDNDRVVVTLAAGQWSRSGTNEQKFTKSQACVELLCNVGATSSPTMSEDDLRAACGLAFSILEIRRGDVEENAYFDRYPHRRSLYARIAELQSNGGQ